MISPDTEININALNTISDLTASLKNLITHEDFTIDDFERLYKAAMLIEDVYSNHVKLDPELPDLDQIGFSLND